MRFGMSKGLVDIRTPQAAPQTNTQVAFSKLFQSQSFLVKQHTLAYLITMFQRDPRAGAFLGGDRVSGQDIRDQNGTFMVLDASSCI